MKTNQLNGWQAGCGEKQAEGFHGNQHTVPAAPAGVQNEHHRPAEKTCERIARENHVSASSVRRAALFAQGVDLADKLCPDIRLQVFRGVLNVPDALFERLAKAPPEEYDAIVEQIKNSLRSSSVWPGASILPF